MAIEKESYDLDQEVRYIREAMSLSKLIEGVQAVIDEYYNKIISIDKNESELIRNSISLDNREKIDKLEMIGENDKSTQNVENRIKLVNEETVETPSTIADQKLAAVVECCQNLDQLHAFADGNVRTATLVLNKFLIELGEYPCIFDNPNVLDLKSIRELVQYMAKKDLNHI